MIDRHAVSIRRNRKTGSLISLIKDGFLGWLTICETHGGWVEHSTRKQASEWLAAPEVWCEGCRAEIDKTRFGRSLP